MQQGGPGEEAVAKKIADRVHSHTVNLAGKLSLVELQNCPPYPYDLKSRGLTLRPGARNSIPCAESAAK